MEKQCTRKKTSSKEFDFLLFYDLLVADNWEFEMEIPDKHDCIYWLRGFVYFHGFGNIHNSRKNLILLPGRIYCWLMNLEEDNKG